MKKLVYIIMMIYYALMGIDLCVGGYLIIFNIFSPPFTLLAFMSNIHSSIVYGLFIMIISGLIISTSLARFYKSNFKILSVILLILVALGNFSVVFDFPTVPICIILIASTIYVSKENVKEV